MEACQLVYDIPTRLNRQCPNPSASLQSRAFRINKSCWVMLKSRVPHSLITRLRERGAVVYLVDFATGQDEALVGMAMTSLRAEVREALKRARAANVAADRSFDANADDPNTSQADNYRRYRANANAIIRRARKLFQSLRAAAQTFGINPDTITVDDLTGQSALNTVDAIQLTMIEKSKAYADAAGIIRRNGGIDHTLIPGMIERDVIPVGIVHDMLQDCDTDEAKEAADALRLAFGRDVYSM